MSEKQAEKVTQLASHASIDLEREELRYMHNRLSIRIFLTLAFIGQIVFYGVSFSRVIATTHGTTYAEVVGGLIGIDFLAVMLTGTCLVAYMGELKAPRALNIPLYIVTVLVVLAVLFVHIRAWIAA